MHQQVKSMVWNFIWGGKSTATKAKVKWETIVLPHHLGGLSVMEPKGLAHAFLVKLLIRGLTPSGEPWKTLVKWRASQTHPFGRDAPTQDIEWLFTTKTLKKTSSTLWNCIMAAWSKIKGNLRKAIHQNLEEVLKQPLFCNTFSCIGWVPHWGQLSWLMCTCQN